MACIVYNCWAAPYLVLPFSSFSYVIMASSHQQHTMDFPVEIELTKLVPDVGLKDTLHLWQRIDYLVDGGQSLEANARQFLPRQPGEVPEVYASRLQYTSYTNILGDVLKTHNHRIVTAFNRVTVDGVAPPDRPLWDNVRRQEANLVGDVMTSVQKYGEVWLYLTNTQPFPLTRDNVPIVSVINPQQVIQRGMDDNGTLLWVLVRSEYMRHVSPLTEAEHVVNYTFITDEAEVTYQAAHYTNKAMPRKAQLVNTTIHDFGVLPIIHFKPTNKAYWTCSAAYTEARKLLQVSSHQLNLAMSAYFQRTYVDANVVPVDPTVAAVQAAFNTDKGDKVQPGLEYVLGNVEFNWSEPTGAILDRLGDIADKTVVSLEKLLDLDTNQTVQQSGTAKVLSYTDQTITLQAYALQLLKLLDNVYGFIARLYDVTVPVLTLPEDALQLQVVTADG